MLANCTPSRPLSPTKTPSAQPTTNDNSQDLAPAHALAGFTVPVQRITQQVTDEIAERTLLLQPILDTLGQAATRLSVAESTATRRNDASYLLFMARATILHHYDEYLRGTLKIPTGYCHAENGIPPPDAFHVSPQLIAPPAAHPGQPSTSPPTISNLLQHQPPQVTPGT